MLERIFSSGDEFQAYIREKSMQRINAVYAYIRASILIRYFQLFQLIIIGELNLSKVFSLIYISSGSLPE